jgi:hypothetical protein
MLIELFIAARLNNAANSLKSNEPLSFSERMLAETLEDWYWKLVERGEERRALKDGLDKE